MQQFMWDALITVTILLALGLMIWAKVSGMTIPELIRQIKEAISGTGEDLTPEVMTWNE